MGDRLQGGRLVLPGIHLHSLDVVPCRRAWSTIASKVSWKQSKVKLRGGKMEDGKGEEKENEKGCEISPRVKQGVCASDTATCLCVID